MSLVDLIQSHMAASDLLSAILTSLLLAASRITFLYDVVEGCRLYGFFLLANGFTMIFEDIATILISIIRCKQVRSNAYISQFFMDNQSLL